MAETTPIQIKSAPGIKRDGTVLEGEAYVDGLWCRFDRNLPRKIGGYRAINKYLSGVVREIDEFTQDSVTHIHCGSANLIEHFTIDGLFNTSVITDRTPTSGFTANDNNLWQFADDGKLSGGMNTMLILAQVAPNLEHISNSEGGELFYGDLLGTAPLTPISLPTGGNATGGICVLHPYTFFFGSDGYVGWSVAGDPTDLSGAGSGALNAAAQKIVRGMPLRGGPGNSPSGLFWAADALVRASFVGGSPVFQFDTLSTQTSILSSRSVIEYDGIFYWLGTDRFLMFNGVVREMKNDLNRDFFFSNLNYEQRQKVFATKVPRFGEIWWCFPKGDSTEPNWALIYNVRLDTWYDTELPNGGRSAGIFPTVFRKPLMTGSAAGVADTYYRVTEDGDSRITEEDDARVTEESEAVTYRLWIHEQGMDEIDGQSMQPIQSYFETSDISLPLNTPAVDKAIQTLMLEPDFVQSGDMTVQVLGRRNARAPQEDGPVMTFPDTATSVDEEVVYLKEERRQLRLRFGSNVIGGDYQMGVPLLHIRPGTGTSL
jgi:hypothetical protein